MKYKSPAIALTYIKQGESSIICKVLTLEKGLQTFIVKGVRLKKSKIKLSFFEPDGVTGVLNWYFHVR